jgi:hypothetical protein
MKQHILVWLITHHPKRTEIIADLLKLPEARAELGNHFMQGARLQEILMRDAYQLIPLPLK